MGRLTYRPAALDEATFVADVLTEVRPSAPVDPVVMRYEWETPAENWIVEHHIVERDGDRIGFARMERPRWEVAEKRFAGVGAEFLPAERRHLEAAFAMTEERALSAGSEILRTRANEDDPVRIGAILRRGFVAGRRGRRWQLDLPANRERLAKMTAESRERMRREGIRLLTLAEESDPEKHVKIWRMSEEAAQDVPTTLPHVPESLDDYLKWFRSPNIREDRLWIAKLGDEVVGISVLGYPPVRGIVGTEWTATARSVRGRGVARALKCETVVQAIALGVDRVRTGNDAANDPILHLNATMGYRPIPGAIEFLKDV